MHLRDEEQLEGGPRQPGWQIDQPPEPFDEGSGREGRRHEDVGSGLVRLLLELAGPLVRVSGHDQAMTSLHQSEELLGRRRDSGA